MIKMTASNKKLFRALPLHSESHCTAFSSFHFPELLQPLDFRYLNLFVDSHFLLHLMIASYINLYIFTPLLYIFPHNALSTDPSAMAPLYIRTLRTPASANLLLRMCINIVRIWNIIIIDTQLLNFF